MNFVNPLFLIGAAAAAIPILLHLIRREHSRTIEFPTLMFLRRISRKTIRYQKLRYLLLLLLRVLALLLIVFAFMRPYREKDQAAAAVGQTANAHIIVLDCSASMDYRDRWKRARETAAGIIQNGAQDDQFAVLEFSDRAAVLTGLTRDKAEAARGIERAEVSDRTTRYGLALRAAEKVALDAAAGKATIYLISDFQKNGWTAEDGDLHLASGIELRYFDLGEDEFSNLAIRDVHVSALDQSSGSAAGISAAVVNFGNLDRKSILVALLAEGRKVAEKRIDVAAGQSQPVEFDIPGSFAGTQSLTLEVEDSNLTRDNRFYLTHESRGKTSVLVVEDNSGRSRPSSFFLSRALNVDAVSPYRLTSVLPQRFSDPGGLVIWNNAGAGSSAAQRKLQDFVRSGGGLAVVLPDSTGAAEFNRSFGTWLPVKAQSGGGSNPFPSRRPHEDFVLLTDVRTDHPIFQPFSGSHSGSFSGAKFYRHARLSVDPGAEIPARFDNGDPALVSIQLGSGRVLVFASSADDSANDLPLKAVYAPFWHQMLRYLENFRERRRWLDVGEIISPKKWLADQIVQAGANIDLSGPVAVLDPEKRRVSFAPGVDEISMDGTGFYEIRASALKLPLAVNSISRESDLTHGDAEEMSAAWTSTKREVFRPNERFSPEEQDRRRRLWALLLLAAALLLLSELFLSNSQPKSGETARAADQPSIVNTAGRDV